MVLNPSNCHIRQSAKKLSRLLHYILFYCRGLSLSVQRSYILTVFDYGFILKSVYKTLYILGMRDMYDIFDSANTFNLNSVKSA